ncbi:drug resistance transporter, EmrB/QacA subfamily [Brevibacterium iodinum ATCC 49514]|uniref:Drug resistance transporter, EmrB/QacA subfamily n=1 Tax=Brevibacterium iodinum ATCC 49514 TaxID=1255616 RepID=A0A2H1HS90_9MICO|nr:MDR family MFS transporter [Brevibacterium iodinum]SMX65803.1 drug resistance transporter, EmrB/QacA subfamily [Brevibacterium iodinum ATCC 49514]SUW13485.1 Multidrug resistance protein B [Brevibacterium iodinum]
MPLANGDDIQKDPSEGTPVNRNLVLAVLVSGAFVIILNQTLLNTALPAFMHYFEITSGAAQWVTTSFMLVNGIMIPVTAFLIEKFTTRGLFFTAMGLFIIGTLVCAIAPVYPVMLIGRVIQASAGGIIMPLMQTILFAIFPVEKRGSAMGTFGLVIAFAPAIGPSLSGWIVDHLPWQTLFYMMLPIAIIDLIVAYFLLKNVTERTFPRLDVLSIILSTLGFGGLLFGFGTAGDAGWLSAEVLIPLVIGAITLTFFITRQFKLEQPILEFRILRYRMFTLNTLLGMCVFIVMVGGMMVLPLYMQNMNDFSAMESGLVLLPGAAVMGLMSPVTGRVFDAVGAKWLAIAGFVLLTGTTFLFTRLEPDTSFVYLAVVNTVRMFGVAMVMMPVTTAALNQLPSHLIPHGTALNNTLRQIAASVGTAALVTIMVSAARNPETYGMAGLVHGANVAFFVAACVGILGVIGAFFIKNSHGLEPGQKKTAGK